jgi:ferredoxin hydrogenase large subunit
MKRNFVTDINKIKYEVNTEVARLAYEGKLEEKANEIPYKIIPGRKPRYRCCVYREREIIRERVDLASGRISPNSKSPNNIVQVIEAACQGCPINRFTVTNNCQMCLAKRCLGACNFGAIKFEDGHAVIDHTKCKECGKCAEACPYNAIADSERPCKRSCPVNAITMDEDDIVEIDESKCIHCGQCVVNCPFGALSDRSFIVDVINMIKNGEEVYAMVAPASSAVFGPDVTTGKLRAALKDLGFKDMYEVSLGADFVSKHEGEEFLEHYEKGEKMTTSCCSAFVTLIRKHFPEDVKNISSTVTPMTATGRIVKAMHPNAICVFIGPCIAKKSEVIDSVTLGGADYALTYFELLSMFDAKNIDPEDYEDEMQQGSKFGMNYCIAGGVAGAVLESIKESGNAPDVKVRRCSGTEECKKALTLLKVGKLPEDLVEGMACVGGCICGPGMLEKSRTFMKDRMKQLAATDDRGVNENVVQYDDLHVDMVREDVE